MEKLSVDSPPSQRTEAGGSITGVRALGPTA